MNVWPPIARLWTRALNLFRSQGDKSWASTKGSTAEEVAASDDTLDAPANLEAIPQATPVPADDRTIDLTFMHVSDLLDRLPECRRLIQRLKKVDKAAFEFHRRVGARLLPDAGERNRVFLWGTLHEEFLDTLPGSGLVLLTGLWAHDEDETDENDRWAGAYHYFERRIRPPWNALAELAAEKQLACYKMVIAWAPPRKSERPFAYAFHVIVDRHGQVIVMPEKHQRPQSLPKGGCLYHETWKVPEMLEFHYKERKEHFAKKLDKSFEYASAADFGADIFRHCCNVYMQSTEEFQVTAERHTIALAFSVADKRTPKFFRDRDIVLASDGRRQRIFHAVEAHERILRSGKVISVASHYRGSRKFTWKGENIRIDPPEGSMRFFNVPSLPAEERRPDDPPMVDTMKYAPKLAEALAKRADVRGGYRIHQPLRFNPQNAKRRHLSKPMEDDNARD
jgi:hypothetical protein